MRMPLSISANNIRNLLIILYLILFLVKFSFDDSVASLCSAAILVISIFSLILYLKKERNRVKFKLISLLFVLSFIAAVNLLIGDNFDAKALVQVIFSPFSALLLLAVRINMKILKAYMAFVFGYFMYFAIRGVSPGELFFISHNYVSVYVILVMSIYFIACAQNLETPSILYSLAAFVLCLWGIGRSGMIVGGWLFISSIIVAQRSLRQKVFILAVVACVTVALFVYLDLNSIFYGLERLDNMGFEDVRSTVNKSYAHEALKGPKNILFGAPLQNIPEVAALDGNPHNSFIRLHVHYGLLGFLVVCGTIFFVSIWHLKKRNFILVAVVFACLIRSSTDVAAFYGPLDIVIFYCLLIPFHHWLKITKLKFN